jgi:hypothetical protein
MRARRAVTAGFFAEAVEKLSPEEAETLTVAVPVIERLRELVDAQRGVTQDRK